MRTRRGRSLVGTRAVYNVTSIRSRNISACCSMNKRDIFKYSTQTRPFNTDTFLNCIREMIQTLSSQNIFSAVIIMDKVLFHRSRIIDQEITSGGHEVIFFPLYSPFLNSIENLFFSVETTCKKSKS
ncbi:hypothetical protein CDIK_2306 [Cucumispora dikerogammari]|nr:hypothetical protein CDIK_2306 [Cucumispora dikerogammari]